MDPRVSFLGPDPLYFQPMQTDPTMSMYYKKVSPVFRTTSVLILELNLFTRNFIAY